MHARLTVALAVCASLVFAARRGIGAEATRVLENTRLALHFDAHSDTLVALHDKLTGETYRVSGDEFAMEAAEFKLDFSQVKLTSWKQQGEKVESQYRGGEMTIEVTYALGREHHFAEIAADNLVQPPTSGRARPTGYSTPPASSTACSCRSPGIYFLVVGQSET